MNQLINFSDVNILPKFSSVASKEVVNLSVNRPGFPYATLPLILGNIPLDSDLTNLRESFRCGSEALLPWNCSIEDSLEMFMNSRCGGYGNIQVPMVSIGLGMKELERAEALRDAGAMTFFIDVTHGASMSMVLQARQLRDVLGPDFGVVVGNFSTGNSIETFLDHAGSIVDGFVVGNSNDIVANTGVGIPQLSALIDCRSAVTKAGLTMISKGNIEINTDVCKALAAGAHFVMVDDYMLQKYEDSNFWEDSVRGALLDIEDSVKETLLMVGASSIEEYHRLAEFIVVSQASRGSK